MRTLAQQCADRARAVSRKGYLRLILPTGSESNLAPINTLFTEMTGIEVRTQVTPVDDINTYILLANQRKDSGFDVAIPATYGIADLVDAGAIQPLDEFADRYEPEDLSSQELYRVGDRFQGRFYGYQTDGDAYVMFFNQTVARNPEVANALAPILEPGDVPVNWTQLDAVMRAAHSPEQNTYGGSLYRSHGYLIWEFWLRMHEKGVLPMTADGNPNIDHPLAVDALNELLIASAYQEPGVGTNGLFENWHSYVAGNKLINIGWGGSQKFFRRYSPEFSDELITFHAPGRTNGKRGLPYFNWGWNLTVSTKSDQAELAYLYTLFATSPEVSTASVRAAAGYFDPHQLGHYQDQQIIDTYSQAFLDVHRDGMQRCIPDLYIVNHGRYKEALSRFLQLAYRGKLKPELALRYAAAEWRRLHADIGLQKQQQAWLELAANYPKMDNLV